MPTGFSAAYGAQQDPGNLMELSQGIWDHGRSASGCDVLDHSGPQDNESRGGSGDKGP